MAQDKGYYIKGLEDHTRGGVVFGGDFQSAAMKLSQQLHQKRDATPYAERPYLTDFEMVHLVFGEPIVKAFNDFQVVKTIEKAFTLNRSSDPDTEGLVYLIKHDTSKRDYQITWETALDATPVPITRELKRVFDVDAAKYTEKLEKYGHQVNLAFREGMRRAGLAWKDAPRHPSKEASPEKVSVYQQAFQEFYQKVVKYVTPPRTPLVKVVGIDSILESIPVRSQALRY